MDLLLLGRLSCVYDDRMFEEYLAVLSRPRFAGRITTMDRDWLLDYVRAFGLHVGAEPLRGIAASDVPGPDDLKFAEVAVAGMADLHVTGNARHFGFLERGPWDVKVCSPAEALAIAC